MIVATPVGKLDNAQQHVPGSVIHLVLANFRIKGVKSVDAMRMVKRVISMECAREPCVGEVQGYWTHVVA